MKVILLHESAINPIRVPLFNKVFFYLSNNGILLKVFWLKTRIKDKYWTSVLSSIKHEYSIITRCHDLFMRLFAENPDIIIASYGFLSGWLGLIYALTHRKKLILWTGSWMHATEHKNFLYNLAKRLYIKLCSCYITYGSKSAEYLRSLGALSKKIFVVFNVSDVEYFNERVFNFRMSPFFSQIRNKYGKIVCIFVGRLTRSKGIMHLLNAFLQLRDNLEWQLLVSGEGPLRTEIEAFVRRYNLTERIKILGFVDKPELVKYYAIADIFILPTFFDRYSLVLSEALASGLYCLSSKYDGASYDLIVENLNGNIINPNSIENTVFHLKQVFENFERLPSRNDIAKTVITYTIDNYARNICNAIYYCIKNF